jgi:hypothetical protein
MVNLRTWLALIVAALLPASALAAGEAPYSGWQERSIKALSADMLADLRSGRGMGMALPAELNGYPGPVHVLELAEQLQLSAEQQAAARQLFEEMQTEAIVLGARVIAGEAALEGLFATGTATDAAIEVAAVEVGRAQGALRAHHLRYHLAMRELLSPHQVMRYQQLRGYATGSAHGHDAHGGHAP